MSFQVRPDSSVPIYEQIVTGVIYAVAGGELPPGELVPSVRETAQRLLVHPNTVARAFQDLERAGILEAWRGKGMAVTPAGPDLARERRRAVVRDRIRDALRDAAAARLQLDEVRQIVSEEWVHLNGSTS